MGVDYVSGRGDVIGLLGLRTGLSACMPCKGSVKAYNWVEEGEYGHVDQGWAEGSDECRWDPEPGHVR